jgi:LytS/YehU family sensor histidine kinase
MEFLNGYLEIERIRFRDRLTTLVDVDPSVLDVRVPNLILQPIVEENSLGIRTFSLSSNTDSALT